MKLLILGGTGDARELANALVNSGHDVTSSLAGRTLDPLLPQGSVRIGGFGGVPRLRSYLLEEKFDWVIDATHPYAADMSNQACLAAELAGMRFLRLERPGWTAPAEAIWVGFPTIAAAIDAVPPGYRAFVTSGHESLDRLERRPECFFLVRLIEAPEHGLPDNAQLLLARPPYRLKDEIALMREYEISHLITKNSGSTQTRAKIDAAAALHVVTYIVGRPKLAFAKTVTSIAQALAYIHGDAA